MIGANYGFITLIMAKMVGATGHVYSFESDANISQVLASIVKNIMIILGLITALGTLGVNISAIVAGLGLTGFAF